MATMTSTVQAYQIPQNKPATYIGPNGQPSPASSTSPVSPRMSDLNQPYNPNPAKQLRPLKSPLYIPAVLRPTEPEHFTVMSPMTPPKSNRTSLQHIEEIDGYEHMQSDLEAYLSQMQIEETELCVVTGAPKQDHWKPDQASTSCDSSQCKSTFNLFKRKHHCRHCGHIFCAAHSRQTIPLDQEAQFHPDGYQVRACDTCYRQYMKWDTARSLRRKNSEGSGSSQGDDSKSQRSAFPLAQQAQGHRRLQSSAISTYGGPQTQQRHEPSVANSVPKDWAWSTF